MISKFITQPPLRLGQGSGGSLVVQVRRIFWSILRIVWQTFVPFNPRPEEPESLPAPASPLDESQVAQCQWIFDQTEARRDHLEQKAQWTFALILFLTPLVASIFVFLVHENSSNSIGRVVAIFLLLGSVALMLLGFISIVRAVSVQARESLFLGAVVDLTSGQFLVYDKARHAGGLLYCASVNTAMNDHIAQFVKGAHVLTTAAVVILLTAMIPTVAGFSSLQTVQVQTRIVGPVQVFSADVATLRGEIAGLRRVLAATRNDERLRDQLAPLEARIDKMEHELRSRGYHSEGAKR